MCQNKRKATNSTLYKTSQRHNLHVPIRNNSCSRTHTSFDFPLLFIPYPASAMIPWSTFNIFYKQRVSHICYPTSRSIPAEQKRQTISFLYRKTHIIETKRHPCHKIIIANVTTNIYSQQNVSNFFHSSSCRQRVNCIKIFVK